MKMKGGSPNQKPVFMPKYLPTPLPCINPEKAEKALELIQPKNRDKFGRNPMLINRLPNLNAVYSKPLIPNTMKVQIKKSQRSSSRHTPSPGPAPEKSGKSSRSKLATARRKKSKEAVSQEPITRLHNGLAYRCWTDPVKKCGNWILTFPFDTYSYEMSRCSKFHALDVAGLVGWNII